MRKGIALALLAAALYAVNAPFSKLLLSSVPPTLMAGFLYVGAGVGMAAIALTRRLRGKQGREMRLTRRELPWTVAMIALDYRRAHLPDAGAARHHGGQRRAAEQL